MTKSVNSDRHTKPCKKPFVSPLRRKSVIPGGQAEAPKYRCPRIRAGRLFISRLALHDYFHCPGINSELAILQSPGKVTLLLTTIEQMSHVGFRPDRYCRRNGARFVVKVKLLTRLPMVQLDNGSKQGDYEK